MLGDQPCRHGGLFANHADFRPAAGLQNRPKPLPVLQIDLECEVYCPCIMRIAHKHIASCLVCFGSGIKHRCN